MNRSGNTGKYSSSSLETEKAGFLFHRKVRPMKQKTLREDRTAAEWNYVADATRRRRRISQARFFLVLPKNYTAVSHTLLEQEERKLDRKNIILPQLLPIHRASLILEILMRLF